MTAAGVSALRVLQVGKPPISVEDGAKAAPKLLERYPDLDCIFCVSDAPAFGVLSALGSLGKSVPGDIGVAGFGDFEVSRFSTPSITTVTVDPRRIGHATGQLIAQLFSTEGDVSPLHIPVAAELSFRGSTKS